MTRQPATVSPDASALEAVEQLVDGGFRHLPVVAEEGVVGIVALEDLRAALPFQVGLSPLAREERIHAMEYRVGDLMTYGPFTAGPETPLETAAELLLERRIGCLPVVEPDGKLAGIFTTTDALSALMALLRQEARPPAPAPGPGDLATLADDLRAERDRILGQLGRRELEEREISTEMHDEPGDAADHGNAEYQVALSGALADFAARRVNEIERALDRHARGQLGVCTVCGGTIPLARLRVLPGTDRCMKCAQEAAG